MRSVTPGRFSVFSAMGVFVTDTQRGERLMRFNTHERIVLVIGLITFALFAPTQVRSMVELVMVAHLAGKLVFGH